MVQDVNKPFVSGIFLELASTGSPTVWQRICEATGISGIGQTNAQVDSTTFCSGGYREYIPGLADGSEITVDAQYVISSTVRRQLAQAVRDRANVQLRLIVDPDGNVDPETGEGEPVEEYRFEAAALSYGLTPSLDDKNTMAFGLKISGEIIYIDNYEPAP